MSRYGLCRPQPLQLVLLCALQLTAASLSAVRMPESHAPLSCAGGFTLWQRHCYHYPGAVVRRSFHHAERHCGRLQATLASLLSAQEESFALQLVKNETAIWIGLTVGQGEREAHGLTGKQKEFEASFKRQTDSTFDQLQSKREVEFTSEEKEFKWTDGSAISHHASWQEGEPRSAGHLHCAQAGLEGWSMASGGCASTRLPFVCKKQACPPGLDWSGHDCDIILPPPSPPPPPLLSTSLLFTLSLLTLSLFTILILYYTYKYVCNKLHNNCTAKATISHTPSLHNTNNNTYFSSNETSTHKYTPLHIQDIYPLHHNNVSYDPS